MAFKIQDLMTDILPEPVRWASCSGGTTCRGAIGAGIFAAGSKGGENKSPKCRPVSRGQSPRPNPNPKPRPPAEYADLVLLQQQLRQSLGGPRV